MIALLAALCVSAVALGGGLILQSPLAGFILIGLASILLGFLFAVALNGVGVWGVKLDPDALTTGRLSATLTTTPPDTLVYVANPTISPASGMFECMLGGRRIFVIEALEGEN